MEVDVWVLKLGRAEGRAALADLLASRGRRGFSFSDSGDVAVFAFASTGAVGVDVERVLDREAVDRIAQRIFETTDQSAISTARGRERLERFYRCWTAAEASAKARGEGLPALLSERPRPRLPVTWFEPAPGYVGAVATEGRAPRLLRLGFR